MKELKKINPLSLAKIGGLFGLILGVIADIVISLGFSFTGESMEALSGGMLVLLPIVYGVIYFVSGLVFSWIYNALAKNIGGIKLDI
tara:strand:- start:68 stop:328 length:261 start_codon:yes stop_codon:yes gene_type:complete